MASKKKRITTPGVVAATALSATDKDSKIRALYKEHYNTAKAKYGPRVAVLLEVGIFYELYDTEHIETGTNDTNVRMITEILGALPTISAAIEPNHQYLFWGFPANSLFKYESQLIAASYTCVVINQVKDGGGAVRDRSIDHVSSPGTYWAVQEEGDNTVGGRKEEQGLIGLLIEPYRTAKGTLEWQIGTTRFDITTGNLTSTETAVSLIDERPVFDSIEPFWAMFPPAEIVIWYIGSTFPFKEETVLSWFSGMHKRPPVHIYCSDRTTLLGASAMRERSHFLETQFQTTMHDLPSLLGVERHPTAFASLGLLLTFVQEHVPSLLSFLHSHELWQSEHEVILGNSALEQLGMISNNVARPNESLFYWLNHAKTFIGKETIRARLLHPITNGKDLEERQERIASLRNKEKQGLVQKGLRGIVNLSRIARKIDLQKATALDVLPLLLNLQQIQELIETTKDWRCGLDEMTRTELINYILQPTKERWSPERIRLGLQGAPVSGRAIALGSVHPCCRGVHADLDELEDRWNHQEGEVKKLIAEWEAAIRSPEGIKMEIRDEVPFYVTTTQKRSTELITLVKSRGLLPVTSSKTTSGQYHLSCEFLEKANQVGLEIRSQWLARAEEYWKKDWAEWRVQIHANNRWAVLLEFIGDIDAETTFAILADAYGYVRPVYDFTSPTSYLQCEELRHPIIERVRTGSPYIPHTIHIGCSTAGLPSAQNGILLYGVNAAGKSSLSKAVGLAVLLAQAGVPVPATSMKLSPYLALFTRILGNDNLWAGQSSFTVEMSEFRTILKGATPGTLVLGDELCAGTETISASAIVTAGIQTLVEKGAHFIFATHLHELLEFSEIRTLSHLVKAYHLTVRSDLASGCLVYDRTLREGAGSALYGLEVCRGLDMDAGFLAKAFAIRKQLEGGVRESRYNAEVVVATCKVCDSKKGLETHHIIFQKEASDHKLVNHGTHIHRVSNLVTLCSTCHDHHHRGLIDIRGWVDTTAGKKLDFVILSDLAK
jgi:DNA mismatch repair protein MutS